MWDHARDMVKENGRDVSAFGGELAVFTTKGPAAVAERIEEWGAMGGTHAAVVTMNLGLDSAEAHVDYMAKVADALGR